MRSAFILVLLTLAGKVIGFIREIVIAAIFGATAGTDELFVASGLMSNIVYALMTALSVAFLPLYLDMKEKKGAEAACGFASQVNGKLTAVAIALSVLIAIAAPVLAKIVAPLYDAEALGRVAVYFRILAIGVIFSLTTRMMISLLDAEKRYGFGALCGIIYSVIEIAAVIIFHKQLGVMSICISIPIAYFVQNAFLKVYTRRKLNLCFKLDLSFRDEHLRSLIAAALPILLSNSILEINQLIDRLLASSIIVGGVSALAYAGVLYQFVTALIIGSIITILFTELSDSAAQEDMERERQLYNDGIKSVVIILLPITLISFVCAFDIVKIVYMRGSFEQEAAALTTLVLATYALNFIPHSVNALSTRVFYAHQDTKTPMKLGIITVVINIITSVTLALRFGFIGIPVGTAISSYISMVLQSVIVNKRYHLFSMKLSQATLLKTLCAGAVCLAAILILDQAMVEASSLMRFTGITLVAFAVYLLTLTLLKTQEIVVIMNMIKQKMLFSRPGN